MRTKIFSAIKVSTLALVLSFGLSFVYAWTAPTISAPNGNVSAPINTSATAQTKTGGLNLATVSGGVGIGGGTTASWSKLDVTGPSVFRGDSSQVRLYETDAPNPQFSWHLSLNNGNLTTYYGNDATSGPYYPVMTQASSTGNVGIGDPVPADKLSVAGSIGATGNITSLSTTTTNGLKVANSTAGFGKVLTSDASGNASWQTLAGSVTPQITTYSTATTTTLTVPAGLTSMYVVLAGGGGGGGGGTDTTRSGAGGGGGGGQVKTAIFNNLTPLATYTLTVGGGGGGGSYVDYPYTDPGQNAGNGGITSISGLTGATAAGGGKGNNPFNTGGLGYGGATGGGTSNGARATLVSLVYTAGKGGDCASYGIGGAGGANGTNTGAGNGRNATGNCAGGGGGGSNSRPSSGGSGAPGMAVVRFFAPAGAVTQSEYMTLLDALARQGIATQ